MSEERPGTDAPAEAPADAPADALRLIVAYRARFDECGPDGTLRSSGLMRWAQDAAWIHSERLGFTREWYAARGLWWVVRCAELNVLADVQMGETVSVTTTIVGYRKVWARRRTEVTGASGERVATALTDWVVMGSGGQPARIPNEFLTRLGTRVVAFTPGRVLLPPTPASAHRRPVAVRPVDLDPMAHVNNAAYIDEFDESLLGAGSGAWTTRTPRRYRLEYVAPASLGDPLTAETWPQAQGMAHRLVGPGDADLLRATVDGETAHDAFREAVAARRPWLAPGKDARAG